MFVLGEKMGFSNSNSKPLVIFLSEVYTEVKPVDQDEVKEFDYLRLKLRAWLITVTVILSITRLWFLLMVLLLCLGGRLGIFFWADNSVTLKLGLMCS
jgi:hypothetical protein